MHKVLALSPLLLLAACSTGSNRHESQRAAFAYPPAARVDSVEIEPMPAQGHRGFDTR